MGVFIYSGFDRQFVLGVGFVDAKLALDGCLVAFDLIREARVIVWGA